jgi:hypothetical protein
MKSSQLLFLVAFFSASCSSTQDPAPGKAISSSPSPATISPIVDQTKVIGAETVAVEVEGKVDHVILRGDDWSVHQESWCPHELGSYEQYATFFQRFQAAVIGGNAEAVSKLVRYPLKVFGRDARNIGGKEEFLQRYPDIFSETVLGEIKKAEPRFVFCRDGSAMLGNGVIWASLHDGNVAVDVLNR